MKINTKYLIYHDLIGFYALAKVKSKSSKQGFSDIGMIIDETKNMLITEKNGNLKKYIKKDHVFKIFLPKEVNNDEGFDLEVNGEKIVGRPENRLRNLKKKKWLRK
ncbi:MAG: ribonuclease P protein subunit [Promethearchaeota archaeon]